MILTQEQLNILAHVVTSPQAWADHASVTVGDEAVLAKIDKYKSAYEAESKNPSYLPRLQRVEQ